MHVESSGGFDDRLISRLAGRQHGVVSRRQLLEAGATREQIAVRLEASRLIEVHRGVYLVGSTARPPHAHEMAALLALNLEAALSHHSSGALWDLVSYPASAPVWVTIPPEKRAARPGIVVRRSRLERRDVRRRHGLALTSPPRTILDLASLVDDYELERVVAEAQYRRLASEAELRAQLERNHGRRGSLGLRAILELPGGPHRTRSPAERALLRLLRAHAIGGFETNATVVGFEVDFLWRERHLVIEVDGYDAHAGRTAFERDRLKMATLRAHGFGLMPVTGRQIRDDAQGVVARLLAALGGPTRRPQ
jgi:very-short-patch-repair endonuclease